MRRVLVAFAAVGLLAVGQAVALPCAGFTDVEDTSPFCGAVTWMKNRAVTTGCTVDAYCPDSGVTRAQMALFMSRLERVLPPALADSDGDVLGALDIDDGVASKYVVLIRRGGELFAISVSMDHTSRDFRLHDETIYYQTRFCTGQAYADFFTDTWQVAHKGGVRLGMVTRAPAGMLLFAADPPLLPPLTYPYRSRSVNNVCHIVDPGSRSMYPVTFIENLSLKYTEPFELK